MYTIHIVLKNADETEGRGPMIPVKYILNHDDAVAYIESRPDAYSRQRKWQGERYGDYELRTVPLLESLAEIEEYIPVDFKAQALAKLTDQEKKALGL